MFVKFPKLTKTEEIIVIEAKIKNNCVGKIIFFFSNNN